MSWNETMFPVIIYVWWLKISIEKCISEHVHPTPKASDAFKATLDSSYSIYSFVWQRPKFTITLRLESTEGSLLSPLVMRFPPWEPLSVELHLGPHLWGWEDGSVEIRGKKLCSKLVKDHWINGYMLINMKLKTNIHKRQWLHDRTLEHGERLSSRHFVPHHTPITP